MYATSENDKRSHYIEDAQFINNYLCGISTDQTGTVTQAPWLVTCEKCICALIEKGISLNNPEPDVI
jgi:hypothetical protein